MQAQPIRILIIEDEELTLDLIKQLLHQNPSFSTIIESVQTVQAGIDRLQQGEIDLVLLDWHQPGTRGLETVYRLNNLFAQLPIIILSNLADEEVATQAVAAGAQDYLVKGEFDCRLLIKSIRYSIERQQLRSQIESLNTTLEHQVAEQTAELLQLNQQLQAEIASLRQAELHLQLQANHDALTGLPNRRAFLSYLEQAINRRRQHPNLLFAVLFLDLDCFKKVNDTLGHLAGDELLMAVASRLRQSVRQPDHVARFGGDEFAILLDPITTIEDATTVAQRIAQKLENPFYLRTQTTQNLPWEQYEVCAIEEFNPSPPSSELRQNQVFISTSIGIVLSTIEHSHPEDFLRDADIALYQAKLKGKAGYEIFDQVMHDQAVVKLRHENELRIALDENEFSVYYQPIVEVATHSVIGFEALVRWHHASEGLMVPSEFIAIAEDTGIIIELDWWVLQQACQQLYQWQHQCSGSEHLFISVNFSSKQFLQTDFCQQIERILRQTRLNPKHLNLEITEGTLMENSQVILTRLAWVKQLGITLGIDDFGTGYSSLSYLYRFPLDRLKIDRSFTSCLEAGGKYAKILESLIALAHNLEMDVIVEGVETTKQLALLKNLKCQYVQGYLFAQPLDSNAATALLTR